MDFEAALKINPIDCDLKMQSENLRKLIEAEENRNDMLWNIIYKALKHKCAEIRQKN